jgi:hypothetical protein
LRPHSRIERRDDLLAALLEGYGPVAPGLVARLAEAAWAYAYVQWLWYRAWTGQGDPVPRADTLAEIAQLDARLVRSET